jgi:hypothetical protein
MVIGTDCIDSFKLNYHTITTTTAPLTTLGLINYSMNKIFLIALKGNLIFLDKFSRSHVYPATSESTPVSSTNKTDHHDATEILLKVALNTIALVRPHNINGDRH